VNSHSPISVYRHSEHISDIFLEFVLISRHWTDSRTPHRVFPTDEPLPHCYLSLPIVSIRYLSIDIQHISSLTIAGMFLELSKYQLVSCSIHHKQLGTYGFHNCSNGCFFEPYLDFQLEYRHSENSFRAEKMVMTE
jgi:hypothetical protein